MSYHDFGISGGKSAILTALIVGLGGKATMTNRGVSLKGFVKNGEGLVTCHTLHNTCRLNMSALFVSVKNGSLK